MVAKRRDSKYETNERSGAWQKMRINRGQGASRPAGAAIAFMSIFSYNGATLGVYVRPVAWLGDSRKQVKRFPPEVRRSIGSALYDAQKGEKAPIAKPFKGVGSGVFEIALRFDTDAYRTVYAVQVGKRVYVLHAFQKKSRHGIATPKSDVDLIKQRYRQAVTMEEKE